MNKTLQRYNLPEVAEHLASNYVMGQLSISVTKRVNALRRHYDYKALDDRIYYWEQKLSPLNDATPELAPLPETWQSIQQQLDMGNKKTSPEKAFAGDSPSFWQQLFGNRMFSAGSFASCLLLAMVLVFMPASEDSLSYIAVLEDSNKTPQVVAATYGDSKNLVLEILDLPDITEDESYELWVTSKTDNQVRSLGEIPKDLENFTRQLSDAEWRLITDSAFLLVSVEETGGSPIGEPSDMVISRGLCIQLSAWSAST
jgi:anti-sigma-K factor RskA